MKKGRDKSVRNFHPWLYSGAIAGIEGDPVPGDIVKVVSSQHEFLAWGYYNSRPQIAIRLLEWSENEIIDGSWWRNKISQSILRRHHLADDRSTDSYRLVYSEGDGLPGLIVDKYSDCLVIQSLTAGIERVKEIIIEALVESLKPAGIYERSDDKVRKMEGLEPSSGLRFGKQPPGPLTIIENGLKFKVDIIAGQKTGFYLDQRLNRQKAAAYAKGLDILDGFSHTGAFSVYALNADARSVTLIESSRDSLKLAAENIEINGLDVNKAQFMAGDAFELLREFKADGRRYDMVILDPPKFARSQSNLKKALAGYKDINRLAMELTSPGGYLITFSCSGAVDYQTFQTVLFWAAVDSGKRVQILDDLYQADCHPRLATFPEGTYLTGFCCRIH